MLPCSLYMYIQYSVSKQLDSSNNYLLNSLFCIAGKDKVSYMIIHEPSSTLPAKKTVQYIYIQNTQTS